MRALFPVSLSIGVLCGLWFQVTIWVPWLAAWVGYAAWASFYFSGGDAPAVKKSYVANLAGMVQGLIFFWVWTQIGGGNMGLLSVLIGLFCFVMTMEGAFGLLATIPAPVRGGGGLLRQPGPAQGRSGGDHRAYRGLHADRQPGRPVERKLPTWFQSQKATAPA